MIKELSPLASFLDEILDYRGKTPKKLGADWSPTGYRTLSANHVATDGLKDVGTIRCVDEATYKKWMKREVERGDLLLTSEAPAGQVMLWDSDEKIVLGQRLFGLRCKSRSDGYFLKYYLQSALGQKIINWRTSGSTVSGISVKMFDYIPVISKHTPKARAQIGRVLSQLDALVALNRQVGAELERMTKLLYEYWFVQFDFPMTAGQAKARGRPALEGKPYKASGGEMIYNATLRRHIPEGWTASTLDNLGEVLGGSTPSTGNSENFCLHGTPWITPKDLSNNLGNKFIQRGETDVSITGRETSSLKLMPAGTVLLSSRAPIGYMAIASNPVTTNQGFKSFVPNNGYGSDFIYQTLRHFMKLIQRNATGSTFKEISGGTLKAIRIPMPQRGLSKLYCEKVASFSVQQQNLEYQNQELIQLRDWLLPMLMNGQVKVV